MWASALSDNDVRQILLLGFAIIFFTAIAALAVKLFTWMYHL